MRTELTDGLIVVDKPAGWTSHQVVGRLRRILGIRKVGHAGTLDPMATGVLLVGVGRATRLLGHLARTDKSYAATIRLGQATVTDDAEGEVVEERGAAGLGPAEVEAALAAYRGLIWQVPSAVSAIKVDGRRAYARVRAGEQVELVARQVTVSRFELVSVPVVHRVARRESPADPVTLLDIDVAVDCSSGTSIRALARDLGRDLATGGHLTALRRTRVGAFTETDIALDTEGLAAMSPPALLSMADAAQRSFWCVEVDTATATAARHGRRLDLPMEHDIAAVIAGGELLGLYRRDAAGPAVPLAILVG